MKKSEQLHVSNFPKSTDYSYLTPLLKPVFSKNSAGLRDFSIYYIQSSPQPVTPVFPENAALPDFNGISAPLTLLKPKTGKTISITALSQPSARDGFYFAAWPADVDIPMKILRQISALLTTAGRTKAQPDTGHLIAQLLHDMNTLLDYAEQSLPLNSEKSVYYRSLMRNLLFYIRQPELFIETIRLSVLFPALLEYTAIPADRLLIEHNHPESGIAVDSELMAMAFKALLLNAIEAQPDKTTRVKIHSSIMDQEHPLINLQWLRFIISDSGGSIPVDYAPYIFQPFFTTRKSTGHAGFGLALAKKIIELHRGYIEIYSEKDKGTTVYIYLPTAKI